MGLSSRSGFYNKLMLLEGIFAAVPTPFYSDERVYFRKIEANIAHYSRSLLSGVLLLGSTGEAPLLDDAEIARGVARGRRGRRAGKGAHRRRGARERKVHGRIG